MTNNADTRFLFIDTETGGLDPDKHSLLSIGCVIWDANKGVLDKIEFFIKSKEYYVVQKAQKINKFDINYHNLLAKEPKDVIEKLLTFVYTYFDKNESIPLIGHNIDTYSVFKTFILSGMINENLNSSSDAFKYFNIKVNNRHSALGDCLATVELYEHLISLIKVKD